MDLELKRSSLSDALDSSTSAPEASLRTARGGRPRNSAIRDNCRKPNDDESSHDQEGNRYYYYKHCTTFRSASTAGLWGHLKHHGIQKPTESLHRAISKGAIKEVENLYAQLLKNGQTKLLDTAILARSIDQQLFDQALLDMIIVQRLPYRIVEHKTFHKFCAALNRQSETFIPTSHNTIAARIQNIFPEIKDIVRKAL